MKTGKIPVGVMFTYDALLAPPDRVRFYRRLYGYTDMSNHRRYTYKRSGLLSEIPYLKTTDSTIIVKRSHAQSVRKFFKASGVRYTEHLAILNKREAQKLRIKESKKPSGDLISASI